MLSHPDELLQRLRNLVRDVGPLSTVSGLGFVSDDRALADRALQQISGSSDYGFLDLRRGTPPELAAELRAMLSRPTLVVAIGARLPSGPLASLVRAFADKSPRVDLGDHRPLERPTGTSLVLLMDGADHLDGLGAELQRVPYWDFVP